jgi:heme O synthase-like polyprenyltransferase
MSQTGAFAQKTHALFVLGRVSNLPTVWSNCFAAWLLGGGGSWKCFTLLCLGATLLYTGGMFLNDAFDVEFDRKYRSERPIVSGQISLRFVWIAGGLLLLVGWLAFLPLSFSAAGFAGLLVICIVAYNAVHKKTGLAPLLMAGCRFLLYLTAASAAQLGVSRAVISFAVALFCYIVGLSYIARVESTGRIISRWPTVMLFLPLVIASAFNVRTGLAFQVAVVVQPVWVLWCLLGRMQGSKRRVSSGVAGLLAGIPFVDWLGISCCSSPTVNVVFPALFVLALVLQRVAPAT